MRDQRAGGLVASMRSVARPALQSAAKTAAEKKMIAARLNSTLPPGILRASRLDSA
jgi:hypothetical protein